MTTTNHIIRGDWMSDGKIDNLDRSRQLKITIIDGMAYDATAIEQYPGIPIEDSRVDLTVDEELMAWGASVSFSPDEGELDRIGRQFFRAL